MDCCSGSVTCRICQCLAVTKGTFALPREVSLAVTGRCGAPRRRSAAVSCRRCKWQTVARCYSPRLALTCLGGPVDVADVADVEGVTRKHKTRCAYTKTRQHTNRQTNPKTRPNSTLHHPLQFRNPRFRTSLFFFFSLFDQVKQASK